MRTLLVLFCIFSVVFTVDLLSEIRTDKPSDEIATEVVATNPTLDENLLTLAISRARLDEDIETFQRGILTNDTLKSFLLSPTKHYPKVNTFLTSTSFHNLHDDIEANNDISDDYFNQLETKSREFKEAAIDEDQNEDPGKKYRRHTILFGALYAHALNFKRQSLSQ